MVARGKDARMMGRCTSQAAESLNSAMKRGARKLQCIVAATLRLLKDEEGRFTARKTTAAGRLHGLTPRAQSKLQDVHARVSNLDNVDLHANGLGNGGDGRVRATVRTARGNSYQIVLGGTGDGSMFGSCTCSRPLIGVFPCAHQLSVALFCGVDINTVPPRIFWTATWKAQYPADAAFNTVALPDVKAGEAVSTLRAPVLGLTKRGRKRSTARIPGVLERAQRRVRRAQVCARCGEQGHNSAGCDAAHAAAAAAAAAAVQGGA